MASVQFSHVTKKFGDVVAVNDLDIPIEDKKFLVLVGPSGCGKTTALRCLAGLEDVTEGSILTDNQVVNDISPKDRDIAMLFQSYALYPHMSVFDNMAFGLKLRKTPKEEIKERVHAAAEVDVTELMGNEIFAHLKNGKHGLIGRVDSRSKFQIGETVDVTLNMDNVHIFDSESELTIT